MSFDVSEEIGVTGSDDPVHRRWRFRRRNTILHVIFRQQHQVFLFFLFKRKITIGATSKNKISQILKPVVSMEKSVIGTSETNDRSPRINKKKKQTKWQQHYKLEVWGLNNLTLSNRSLIGLKKIRGRGEFRPGQK